VPGAEGARTTIDYDRSMILYTCPAGTHGANVPLISHPCGVAAQALERAGHDYTVKTVGGFKNIPLSRRGKREEIIALTGQQDVPVLLLDDGSTVQGSGAIVAWAADHSVAAP
jgi:hypothetical protein